MTAQVFDHRIRVTAVVRRPEAEVRAWLAALPLGTSARVVATPAGVVVTLERARRGPLPRRRRTIHALRRQLAAVSHATPPAEQAPRASADTLL